MEKKKFALVVIGRGAQREHNGFINSDYPLHRSVDLPYSYNHLAPMLSG